MKKTIAAVVLGLVTWIVVASIGNRLIRAGMPGYREVEATMAFTQPMMLARLVLGALSSLLAGYVAAWVAGAGGSGAKALAVVLLALFIPMHVALWAKFPRGITSCSLRRSRYWRYWARDCARRGGPARLRRQRFV